ncbi:hypothetical protein [Sporosarcina gallistercoris]|uniref:Pectate lyase superfamily protein domain-containing protein n=1 Tax=Sporosarcina gallistercoris TaxID=2762245 RepID=A0ABR8PKQ9_9BACL|nr:hypothetical protein [Sporosarcina gallistercoris]MBD7908746.1 hypothetical protein [Sporosarcina gallistercoris]
MKIKNVRIRYMAIFVINITIVLYLMWNTEIWGSAHVVQNNLSQQEDTVAVEDFITNESGQTEDYSKAIQQAIDFCASQKKEKVKLRANKVYTIKSGFTVKKGVELEFGTNSVLAVKGNYRVLTVEKDSVIRNGTIQIMDPVFQSEVIFLKGNDQYDASNKTRVENMTIINKSKSNKGTGLSLYAKGKWHNISFVQFENISIVGFKTAIQLKAENPGAGTYSWINANRFGNMTIDDCVIGIHIIGSITIPNESSGNLFTGLQVQLTERSKRLVQADSSYNKFDGMVWDAQRVIGSEPLVVFSAKTENNKLDMNVAANRISDKGRDNKY